MIECVFVEIRYQQDFVRNLKILCGQGVSIGREVGDLVFAHDLEMSGTHFRIEVDGSECRIADLGSTNSTWLNENEIQTATIKDADEIRAGKTTFKFQIQHAISTSPTAPIEPVNISDTSEESAVTTPTPIQGDELAENGLVDSWDALLENIEKPAPPVFLADEPFGGSNRDLAGELTTSPGPDATFREQDVSPAVPLQIEFALIKGEASKDNYVIDATGASQIIIGREEPVDVQVLDEKVSAQHCKISEANRSFVVRDLNSTNGTKLNGQEITEARISDGDELQIGDTMLAIRIKYDR